MANRILNTVVKFKRLFKHGRNGLAFLVPKSWVLSAGITQATLMSSVFDPLHKRIIIEIAEDQNMKGDEDKLEEEINEIDDTEGEENSEKISGPLTV